MTENAIKTAMRLGLDARFVSHLESRLTDSTHLEEAIRMFFAGTLPYGLVCGSDGLIDLARVKERFIKNMMNQFK